MMIAIFLFVLLFLGGGVWKIRQRRLDLWLPSYLRWALSSVLKSAASSASGPKHIFFLFVDHYEPGNGGVDQEEMQRRVSAWLAGYPALAADFRDSSGRPPQHTWFYPPHYPVEYLQQISRLVFDGLGEIEMHLHHEDDTEDSLRVKLVACRDLYGRYGALLTAEEQPRQVYGFIHGNWALANSAGGKFCGVDSELLVLRDTGCYADFTMPSNNLCQTRKINSIYYATNRPGQSKSHDIGTDVEAGRAPSGDLMIFQGPLGINWQRRPLPKIENASITAANPGIKERVDYWVRSGISVKGRPNWIFVKAHTHGAVPRDWEAIFGKQAREMHAYLGSRYNDGVRYKLHYVTAREAYNLVKAAEFEAGKNTPEQYRDYLIPPYANRIVLSDGPYDLVSCVRGVRLELKPSIAGRGKYLLNDFPLRSVEGAFTYLCLECSHDTCLLQLQGQEEGDVTVCLAATYRLESLQFPGEGRAERAMIKDVMTVQLALPGDGRLVPIEFTLSKKTI